MSNAWNSVSSNLTRRSEYPAPLEQEKHMDISTAIIEAAHILGNNRALTEHGTALGGLEAHSMKIAEAINNLSEQMGRIADALEESNRA